MQDVQNIPPPDINSTERDNDFGNHSEFETDFDDEDIEMPDDSIPVPPDQEPVVPIEEPPDEVKPPVTDDSDKPQIIV